MSSFLKEPTYTKKQSDSKYVSNNVFNGVSGNWESTYNTVCSLSSIWSLTAADINLGDIPALSGNWNSTYTTVNSTSSNWLSSNNVIEVAGMFNADGYLTLNIASSTYYIRLYTK